MSVQCCINIALDNAINSVFTGSQIIKGTFCLKINLPITVSTIDVSLVTKSNVIYLYQNVALERHTCRDQTTLCTRRIFPLNETKNEYLKFNEGSFMYSFSLKIPETIHCKYCQESQCIVPTFNQLEGIIDFNYYVRVEIKRQSVGEPSIIFDEPFRYLPLLEPPSSHIGEEVGGILKRRCLSQIDLNNFDLLDSVLDADFLPTPILLPLRDAFSSISSTSSVCVKPLDVQMFMKASLDRSKVICQRPLPLELFIGALQDPCKCEDTNSVFLQQLNIQLIATTDVVIESCISTTELLSTKQIIEVFRIPPQNYKFNLSPLSPVTFNFDNAELKTPLGLQVPPQIIEAASIGIGVIPSFNSCRSRRHYNLRIEAGFSANPISLFAGNNEIETQVPQITLEFKDVFVQSGLSLQEQ